MRVITISILVCMIVGTAFANELGKRLPIICIDGNEDELSCGEGKGYTSGASTTLHSLGRGSSSGNHPNLGSGGNRATTPTSSFGYTYSGNSDAPPTNVVTVTFPVTGRTASELNSSMKSYLEDDRVGETYVAKSPWLLGHRWDTMKGGKFGISKIRIHLTIKRLIPDWRKSDYENAPKCLQKQWAIVLKQISIHEDHHVAAFKTLSARVQKKMAAFVGFETPTLGDLTLHRAYEEALKEIIAEEKAWHATLAGNGVDQLVVCVD